MNKILNTLSQDQTAIVFISGSAGELDWTLPILDYLLNKGFNIKIIFLKKNAYVSVQKNRMLYDYISQKSTQLEIYLCGGYFFEKIEHFGYLAYRISIKLKLAEKPMIKIAYNLIRKLFSKIFKNFFFKYIPSEIFNLRNQKCLIFSEFPSLRRPRDLWLREEFNRAIFFYHPHSPHVYTKDLDKKYSDPQSMNFNNKYFLLLGHPGDYFAINDGREYAALDLEKVFIGHPKYSDTWLQNFREKSQIFRSSLSTRSKINILVLSRGSGSYFDDNAYANLVETTIAGTINDKTANYNLFIKNHPRELNSLWNDIKNKYSSITIIDDHILNIATSVDLVITFWSSGAMDCYELGIPVIELYDPNKHSKQQVFDKDHYTTIYRKLGLVHEAKNEKELKNTISILLKNNFDIQSMKPHSFYMNLMNRSNNWKIVLDKIISANNFKIVKPLK